MTDNEIIKGLECIASEKDVFCKDCSYNKYYLTRCHKNNARDALDLINRQKAEIERLQKTQAQYVKAYFDEFTERLKNDFRLAQLDIGLMNAIVGELVDTMNNEFNTLADFTDLIKAEAVRVFTEKFLKKVHDNHYLLSDRINSKDYGMFTVGIEQAVNETKEEMVGEDKTPSAENNFLYNRFMKKE